VVSSSSSYTWRYCARGVGLFTGNRNYGRAVNSFLPQRFWTAHLFRALSPSPLNLVATSQTWVSAKNVNNHILQDIKCSEELLAFISIHHVYKRCENLWKSHATCKIELYTSRHHDHNNSATYGFNVRPTQLPGIHLSGEELSGKSWTLGKPNKDPRNPKCMWQQKPRRLLNQNPKQISSIYRERERDVQLGYHIWYLIMRMWCLSLCFCLHVRLLPSHCCGNLPHQSSKSRKTTDKDCTKTTRSKCYLEDLDLHITHQAKPCGLPVKFI